MITTITDSELVDSAFHSLPPGDRIEVLTLGASFHRLTLAKRLERALAKLQTLESKYGKTLDQLEAGGLPDEADYAMHEDYVEWRYWQRLKIETETAMKALSIFAPPLEMG